jgi:dihydrofolate reductase
MRYEEVPVSRLINSTTMTVDAVIDVGEWYVSEGGHDGAARSHFEHADGMVFGRKTYEGLAAYWSPLEGPWADMINPMPKFVASRTLEGPLDWNATVIEGDAADGVSKLKDELDGDLMLIGCGELARDLAASGLIDEYRFWVHPSVQGAGTRPFQGEQTVRLQLLESKTFDSGVMLLRYEPAAGR